ncbi:hypothetical protein ANN_07720 [Periplaneta americana]|uniref:Uncharacterized protein n=1 Tax=Periplaneta americana TaxID=6978 RepID=A0ABQ8T0S4_PERAM|nr:hypothetical protein ANN_07720 [Periplaneta americana]
MLDKLLSSFKSEQDIARLLALQESESGAWLHALPSPHIGTLIDSTSFKIAMALRLSCKLCQPHQCICVGIADIYGHHALSCARSKSRIPRHTSLNDIIKRSLTSCGIPSLLEPPGISRADAPSHLPNTSRRAASAAELAVKKKVNKYAHLLDNYIFFPFAVETFGPWSHDAKVLISQIGQILISITGDRRCTTYLRQLCVYRQDSLFELARFSLDMPLKEINMVFSFLLVLIHGTTAYEGPRPTSQLLASRPHAEAEVDNHSTSMESWLPLPEEETLRVADPVRFQMGKCVFTLLTVSASDPSLVCGMEQYELELDKDRESKTNNALKAENPHDSIDYIASLT